MPPLPYVMIIVLNWNGKKDTLACLESLADVTYPNFETVIVDNASTDGSVSAIQHQFPDQTLIRLDTNAGYAGGNNVGLRYALARNADYVLLLNNDTKVASNFLWRMVEATRTGPFIGIVGPTIYYYERPDLIWSVGGAIDWNRGQTRMLGLNTHDIGQWGTTPQRRDFVTGCALLAKRQVIDQIGLLDERFFAYYEETEWCVRAQRAGFKIVHVPRAKVWHKIPLDARGSSPSVHYYMTRNRLLFLKATQAGWAPHLFTLVQYLRTLVSWSLRPRWQAMRDLRSVMLQAICDYYRGRFGCADLQIIGRQTT